MPRTPKCASFWRLSQGRSFGSNSWGAGYWEDVVAHQVHAEDRGSPCSSGSRQSEGGASHAGQGQVGSVKGATSYSWFLFANVIKVLIIWPKRMISTVFDTLEWLAARLILLFTSFTSIEQPLISQHKKALTICRTRMEQVFCTRQSTTTTGTSQTGWWTSIRRACQSGIMWVESQTRIMWVVSHVVFGNWKGESQSTRKQD